MAERDVTDGSNSPTSTSFEEDKAKSFAFTNPIAFDSEESNAKANRTSRGSLENSPTRDSDRTSASAARLDRLRSEVSVDNVTSAPVLPESLENTTAGSAQLEAWKERLVEQIIQGKENIRDKRRREAWQSLQEGSLIDPNGKFRKRWDMAQIVLLIYVAFSVPYRSGFGDSVVLWSAWFWFDAAVDVYFLSDLVVSFRTAFYDGNGELVVDPKQIRSNYLRTWFAVDFSSCFPGNYISCAISVHRLTQPVDTGRSLRSLPQVCCRGLGGRHQIQPHDQVAANAAFAKAVEVGTNQQAATTVRGRIRGSANDVQAGEARCADYFCGALVRAAATANKLQQQRPKLTLDALVWYAFC